MSGPLKTAPSPPGNPDALKGVPIVNVVIDLGDLDHEKPHTAQEIAEHDRYIKGVRDTAAALRAQGIPTVYVVITDQNKIHDKWNKHTVGDLHLTEFGVAPGDVIFQKRFMSGFTTLEDLKSPAMQKYISGQRPDGADFMKAFDDSPDATLTHLLKDAKHIILNGAMGQFCITDNAIDAVKLGKTVTVLSDNVAVWEKMDKFEKVVTGDPAFSAQQMRATLDDLARHPEKRAVDPAAAAKLSGVDVTTSGDLMKKLPGLKASVAAQNAAPPRAQRKSPGMG